jgi:hypothetical protein
MPRRLPSLQACPPIHRWVLGLALALFLAGAVSAQSSREYDLKAVFLYNFATFVEWPEKVRPPAGKPIIIGILGRDPFGAVLDEVVAGENLKGNPLEVRRYRSAEAASECHILFISASEAPRLPQILRILDGTPVLTVADMPRFAEAGGIITFSTGDRVQLHVNTAAAQRAGLSISSKLLRVATVTAQGRTP